MIIYSKNGKYNKICIFPLWNDQGARKTKILVQNKIKFHPKKQGKMVREIFFSKM